MSQHAVLNVRDHRDITVHLDAGAKYGDETMAATVMPAEFRQVQGDYPIVFARDDTTRSFSALALFGFENGENLFLDGDRWDAVYRPLSIVVQPFLIGNPPQQGGEPQVHIDMGSPRIGQDGEGEALFDDDQRPTQVVERAAAQLGLLHSWHEDSRDFFAALQRYELLEPFTFEVPLSDGSKNSLVGFHIIDEARFHALDAEALGALHSQGHLVPITMALASLSQFPHLVQRKDRKVMSG